MKISSLVKCALAFLFGALVATPHLASAQTTNVIFNYTTKAWDFHARATAPAANWKDPGFVPTTGWSNGFGVFSTAPAETLHVAAVAAGASINTTLSTNGGGYVVTYYYRTTFNFTNDPLGAILIVSNMVDDGAVFYVNGLEVRRTRMPTGTISHTTYANVNAEVANFNDTFTLPATSLIQGLNTIAVEVHQVAPVGAFPSPDSVFGLALAVELPGGGPARITSQPSGGTVTEGQSFTFTVQAQGTPVLQYQWRRNGAPIPDATNSTYQITGATGAHEGTYSVVVSNAEGTVTSRNVIFQVNRLALVPENAVWRYFSTGAHPGVGWQDPGFNDTAWRSGPGAFGTETSQPAAGAIRTPIPLTNSAGATVMAMYFRTTFNWSGNPSTFTMMLSNLVDDGVIIYLNGAEIYRLNMSGNNPSETATASATVGEAAWLSVELPSELILEGQNTLAAEVHQVNSTSSDIVFGAVLNPIRPAPSFLRITADPQDITVEEGKSALLRVEYTGGGANFQWYKNGEAIPGADRGFLRFDNVTLADAGTYYVVLQNNINTAQSQPAVLSVIADTNPPVVITALRGSPATNIVVAFSEALDPTTATNLANYQLATAIGGANVTITHARLFQQTNVILRVSTLQDNANYILTINNVRDASPSTNSIAANTKVAIGANITPVPFDAPWTFYQFGDNLHAVNGEDWKAIDFSERDAFGDPWQLGQGVFKKSLNDVPGPDGTTLSVHSSIVTYYFRNRFVLNASPAGAQLYLRTIIDDGAVFYLNGVEFLRVRMPGGDITATTRALDPEVGEPNISDPILVPLHLLRAGTNVFAVELHQHNNGFEDAVFGAELQAVVSSFIGGPVSITRSPTNMTVVEGTLASFDVGAVSASTFQWFRNGQLISGATNAAYAFIARTNDSGARFSVRVGNTNNETAMSTEGTLTVISDTTGPMLLTARGITNMTQVVVTFSEAVEPGSATALANYSITNSLGAALSVVGASVSNATTIVLTTSIRNTEPYILRVRNITDLAAARNRIAPESGATISFNALLMAHTNFWRWTDTLRAEAPGWEATNFNDSNWWYGRGPIGEESATIPWPLSTPLTNYTRTNITYYFRGGFNLPGSSAEGVVLRVRHAIDDGGVFYLNGEEFLRVRMNAGDPTWSTVATGGPASEGEIVTLNITNAPGLRPGTNVVAVEVHQVNADSSDLIFGLEISLEGVTEPVTGTLPPPAPTGLTAQVNQSGVTLTWQAAAGATSYDIKRSTTSGTNYTVIASGINITTFTDSTVVSGTNYFYVVSGNNSGGQGANSAQVSVTPLDVPAAPTGLAATAGNGSVRLSWNASANATGYILRRSTASNGTFTVVSSNITSLTFTNTGLSNGTTYWFRISALNQTVESSASAAVSATPSAGTPPPAPAGLIATAGNAQVRLNWTAVTGATSYNVKRGTASGGPFTTVASNITSTVYTNTGLANGTTYHFVVTAVNASGESANSNVASATPTNSTNGPSLTIARGTNAVILNWNRLATDVLESSTTVTGSWSQFSIQAPPLTVPTTNNARFFRVRRPN